MTGCYLTKEDNWLYMVATDGRRMSLCTCADFSPEFTSAIIPVKGLSVIDRICQEEGQIEINTTDKTFFFKGYGYEISSSLIEGQFPMWQKVVPNGLDHTVTISKADLEDAIKRTVIMAAKNGRIQMILDSDKMVISSPENEVGSSKEEIEAKKVMESYVASFLVYSGFSEYGDNNAFIDSIPSEIHFPKSEIKINKWIICRFYAN